MATVTPRLDRPKPAAPRPERFWSPKKWKLYLFALWLAGTAFWVPIAAERAHMDYVFHTYGLYTHYERAIQDGRQNGSHLRNSYRRAEARLKTADQYIVAFAVTGIVWPLLILAGGAWLLRNAK